MKLLRKIFIIALISFWILPDAPAQCPMCSMSVESNLKAGGTTGKGLNKGILYLFAMPYLLVGTLGYLWWKNVKREDQLDTGEDL